MAFSNEEIRDLKIRIDAALNGGRLDAWQTGFLTDIRACIERYGTNTRLSDKQVAKIYECLGGEGRPSQAIREQRYGAARPRQPRRSRLQRKKSSFHVRKARWFGRRFATWFVFAVIVGGTVGYYMAELERGGETDLNVNSAPEAIGNRAQNPSTSSAQSKGAAIVGRASVIDGDTLEIHGTRIRLYGIDAPESGQSCTVRGKQWRCGQQAALALANKIGSRTVSCEARDRDRYNRVVAVCRAGGEDLNAWMVAEGWAMAYRRYSPDYVRQENSALASKIGIWQGDFIAPWDWRRGKRLGAKETQQSSGCVIKGNISRRGERIYHVPGGEFYDRTKIDTAKGERMFCGEAEARAAGWRASRR